MTPAARNHFELLGLPQGYALDTAALEGAYRRLQATVHPDRAEAGDDAAQRAAIEASARANEAYRTLRDPVLRASYLLQLRGVDAFDETDTRLALPFLEQQLERRERAADAADVEDVATLERLVDEVRAEIASREGRLGAVLEGLDAPGAAKQAGAGYEVAKTQVRELRFLTKLADDVNGMLAALDD